ncbi:hypothetical protein ACQP1O_35640 [Nocardia sp. CA-151230]|uniref:hypothetical protein n=1 Tax=Nocardia sp. CA-151230 TaxID=3239982 RepID=UPI003D8C5995
MLALGTGPLTFAAATAPAAPIDPNFPNPGTQGGEQQNGDQQKGGQPKIEQPMKDEHVEKAEKLGGGVITKAIDTWADTLKCTLNIVLPTVKCG